MVSSYEGYLAKVRAYVNEKDDNKKKRSSRELNFRRPLLPQDQCEKGDNNPKNNHEKKVVLAAGSTLLVAMNVDDQKIGDLDISLNLPVFTAEDLDPAIWECH